MSQRLFIGLQVRHSSDLYLCIASMLSIYKATPNWYLGLRILFLKIRSERANFFYFCTQNFFHNLKERANVFLLLLLLQSKESGGASDIVFFLFFFFFFFFFFTHKIFIDWQFEAFCTKYIKTVMSNSLELYGNVFVLSFWYFSVWISCYIIYGQYGTLNIKHILSLVCLWCGALFLLANFVNGASAYCFSFTSIFFSNEQANPKTRSKLNVFVTCGTVALNA